MAERFRLQGTQRSNGARPNRQRHWTDGPWRGKFFAMR